MRLPIFLISILFFCHEAAGEENPYEKVDSLMLTFHKKVKNAGDLKDVWYFIYQHIYADSLRLRAAVDWIAENIAYDVGSWQTENPKAGNISYVLKSKKAVCEGYAQLLKNLCDLLNIECKVVIGTGRAFDREIYLNQSRLFGNHVWNVVKINGGCKLIDPTWIAGHVTGDVDDPKTRFEKEFDETYYFTSPQKFILNHFPSQSQYQLLSPSVNEKTFRKSPLCLDPFLRDSITQVSPNEALIKASVGDTLCFRFKTTAGYLRIISWSPTQKKAEYEDDLFTENAWAEFKYPVTVSGYYNLYLGRKAGMSGWPLLAHKLQIDSKRSRK